MTQPKPNKPPLLRSESVAEYLELRTRLIQEIKPQDVIEEKGLEEIANLVWDIKRLRGLRINTIRLAYGPALRNLLKHLLADPRSIVPDAGLDKRVRVLARGWLENDPAAKQQVADVLGRVDLDESAIEAEAMKLSADDMQYLDRSLAMASSRLDKALRLIMDYRGSDFANRLRQKSDEILNEPQGPQAIDSGDAEQQAAA
jgi:hypothetical protein